MLFSNFLNFLLKRTVPSLDLFLKAFGRREEHPEGSTLRFKLFFIEISLVRATRCLPKI